MPESSAAAVTGHLALRTVPGAAFGAAAVVWAPVPRWLAKRARKARSGHGEPPVDVSEQEAA